MKKIYINLLLGLLLIGIVMAGAGIITTDKDVIITKERLTALQGITGTIIAPEVSAIKCNEKICQARIYQEDLIDDVWTIPKTNLLTQQEYTSKELETLRDNYVKEKLEQIADEKLHPQTSIITKSVEKGTLTFKDK